MHKLIKNTSIYTLGNILPQAAGLFLLPIYTRYLTPADYGIVSSMQLLQAILAVFFTLCIERSMIRLYWDYKTEEAKRDYLGTITISLVIIAVSVLSLLFIFRAFVGQIYKAIDFYPFYVYVILTAFISVFSCVPKIYLMLKEQAGKFITLSIAQFILSTVLVLWFVIVGREGAVGMLKGKMLGVLLLVPIFLYISYKIINFKFKIDILKESLSFSLPMVPTIICAWVLNLSDRIFIERYFSLADVGIYSLGYRIGMSGVILLSAFGMAYGPVFFKLANSERQEEAKNKLYKYNNLYILISITVCFLVVFFAKEAITLLLDKQYHKAYLFVPLISLTYLFSQYQGIVGLSIKQSKKMKQNMFIAVGCALTNILLNFLLVPTYGAYGAAYATLLSFIIGFIAIYIYAKKKCYFIPFKWKQIISYSSILAVIVLLFQYVIRLNIYTSLIIKTVIICSILLIFTKKYHRQIKIMLAKS